MLWNGLATGGEKEPLLLDAHISDVYGLLSTLFPENEGVISTPPSSLKEMVAKDAPLLYLLSLHDYNDPQTFNLPFSSKGVIA